MEKKTTADNTNNQFSNLSSPFKEPPPRSPLELEQAQTHVDEPFWFKVLCFLGAVYPILRENGKCNLNWKTVCWSILPFVWTVACMLVVFFHGSTIAKIIYTLLLILPLSLSYTRKPFLDAVVGEENRLYVNTVAKLGVIVGVIGVIVGVIGVIGALVFVGVLVCQVMLVCVYCLYLTHGSVTQQKAEVMEMVNGTAMEALQTKLLEISRRTQKASAKYVQAPLSVLFVLGFMMVLLSGNSLYRYHNNLSIVWVILYGTALVIPLWLLTRIEKFYLWTLRNELHWNTIMPQTEQTNLLVKYDTIAPRASIFGIYITRGRVASIILTIFGAIIPKIGMYIYEHI